MGARAEVLASQKERSVAVSAATCNPILTGAVTLMADAFALTVSAGLALLLWNTVNHSFPPEPYLRLWPVILVFLAAFAARGLYPGVGLSPVEELRTLMVTTTIVYLVWSTSIFLTREADFSRGFLLGGWMLSVVLLPLARASVRGMFAAKPWWGVPVLVMGAGRAGRAVVANLLAQPGLGLKPLAFLDDDPEKPLEYGGIPVAGPLALAPVLARRLRVHCALVAMPSLSRDQLLGVLERNGSVFGQLIVLPDLFGMASLWVSARDLGGMLGLEVRQNLLSPFNRRLKRGLDLLVAGTAALCALPIVAAAVLWIKRVSPGPAFFVQERGGECGCPIHVHKLRTMYPRADELLDRHLNAHPEARREWDRYFKLKDDPRLLPGIGPLLRRTSLDELPQLWNILRGEMSLVGPRPFPGYHLDRFDADFRALRSRVLPGLTGLWQVSARSNGDLKVQQALDTYYIRNWSLWLDIHILARTFRAVLFRQGAY